MGLSRAIASLGLLSSVLIWAVTPCFAQSLEPRRWAHLPIDTNFNALAYGYTGADISFNPVLLIEDATVELHTVAAGYIRTFELFEKSARVDVLQTWQDGSWTGLLDGVPTTVERTGFSDTVVRFAAYRAATDIETLVGVGVSVQLPTGEYKKDKLINLGSNRFTFRPQIGIMHNRGPWSFEAAGSAWIYTDNNSFFNGNRLEQDPFYTKSRRG